jgi:hypothetical protein
MREPSGSGIEKSADISFPWNTNGSPHSICIVLAARTLPCASTKRRCATPMSVPLNLAPLLSLVCNTKLCRVVGTPQSAGQFRFNNSAFELSGGFVVAAFGRALSARRPSAGARATADPRAPGCRVNSCPVVRRDAAFPARRTSQSLQAVRLREEIAPNVTAEIRRAVI